MRLENFTLEISGGTERPNGQVLMNHGEEYAIVLRNHTHNPADVELRVDGNSVGTFRINSHASVRLERPENDNGKYTFFRLGSTEANLGGIQDSNSLGLVTAIFRSGTRRDVQIKSIAKSATRRTFGGIQGQSTGYLCAAQAPVASAMYTATGAGGTALTGASAQRFDTVENLDYDGTEVTINLRLVEDLKSSANIRPLTKKIVATPIPPKA